MKTILTCAVLACAAGCAASKDNSVTPNMPAEKKLEQRIDTLEKRVTDHEAMNQEHAQQIAELHTQLVERGERDFPPDLSEPPKVALFRAQLESFTDDVHAAVSVLSLGTTLDVAQQRRETIIRKYSLIVIPPTLKFSSDMNVTKAVEIIESDLVSIAAQVNSLVAAYEQLIDIQAKKKNKLVAAARSHLDRKAAERQEAECHTILDDSFQIIEDSATSIERHVLHNFRKPFPRTASPAAE